MGYYRFGRKAAHIKEKMENLIKIKTFDDTEAIKVLHNIILSAHLQDKNKNDEGTDVSTVKHLPPQ